MRQTFQRALVFDHGFGNLPGHWPGFHRVLADQCRQAGLEVSILGYKEQDAALTGDLPWSPFFQHGPAACFNPDLEINHRLRNQMFLQELQQLPVDTCGRSDVFIFPMVMNYELEAIVKFAECFERGRSPAFLVLLQFDNGLAPPEVPDLPFVVRFDRRLKGITRRARGGPEQDHARVGRLYRSALQSVSKEALRRVAFMAPSDGLDELYSRVLGTPVHPYCMPFSTPDQGPFGAADRPCNGARRPLRVGFLGHSCTRKGLQFVPSIVTATRAAFPDVHFEVQVNYSPEYPLAYLFEGPFDNPEENVVYHFGHLDNSQYFSILARSDVVLMPYSNVVYRYMPSGLLREAIAFGKVLVVPEGTSLARQARSVDTGAVMFQECSAEAAAGALIGALSHFDTLAERSRRAAPRWAELHNPPRFMRQLLEQARRVSSWS